ncbi:hypothetical protein CBER1_05227 [Cercospora berteroae]|uniref:Uncharacterized protein n=1 Tax=Cercospora berteroae TaxID=357750 RepID=A0A2S6BT44_9PEZI|nr:hypothetical protein CBER1_05227 [Cercospora berteroae]
MTIPPGLRQRVKKFQVPQPETGTYAIDHYTSPDLVPLTEDRGWAAVITSPTTLPLDLLGAYVARNFYGLCSGILVTDFWIVRKRLIKTDDLYRGNNESIYWYFKGFNWRAYAAFIIGVIPAMPGYVTSVSDLDRAPNSAMKLSRLGFLTGIFISSLAFWFLSTIFPPPGIGQGTKTHNEDELILPTGYRQDCPTQGKYSVPIDGVAVCRESESEKREEGYDMEGGVKESVITKL